MAIIAADVLKRLKDRGFYPFAAIFRWDHTLDEEAQDKFQNAFKTMPDFGAIDPDTIQCYYLTGERTLLFIGYANSAVGIEQFCKSIIFNSAIKGRFFHIVEAHDLFSVYKKL